MNIDTIREVAWVGDQFVRAPIRGVILVFHGLGAPGLKTDLSTEEIGWSEAGGLVVMPYAGPWSWMNRESRRFVDDLVEAIYRQFDLAPKTPLISTGGSMGGQCALLYTRYARKPVTACLASYPVCDVKYHSTERPDLPRTFHHAFRGYPEDRETLFAEHSPLSQVGAMPDIPYLIVHGDADQAVSKTQHSDRMVAAMRQRGLTVRYLEVPGMGHGGPTPLRIIEERIRFVTSFL